MLAGFIPEDEEVAETDAVRSSTTLPRSDSRILSGKRSLPDDWAVEGEELEWLGRYGRALAKMPPGRERDLWKDSLRKDTELIESFLERLIG